MEAYEQGYHGAYNGNNMGQYDQNGMAGYENMGYDEWGNPLNGYDEFGNPMAYDQWGNPIIGYYAGNQDGYYDENGYWIQQNHEEQNDQMLQQEAAKNMGTFAVDLTVFVGLVGFDWVWLR